MQWNQGIQWDDTRRNTLADLIARFRMGLSEPQSGSWGTVIYDIDADFAADTTDFEDADMPEPGKYAVNELALMLNLAQEYTIRDLYDRGFAFQESSERFSVVTGMDTAALPGDFMAVESLFHHIGNKKHEIDKTSLKGLQDTDYETITYTRPHFFSSYEVHGNEGGVVVQGQLAVEDVSMNDDELIVPEAGIAVLDVGDYVLNETDGCAARIKSIDGRTLSLSVLTGGRTDTFEALDYYTIRSGVQPYECLNLWPKMKQLKEESVYVGAPQGWTVKEWVYPTRLRFYLDSLPVNMHPLKTRIHAIIQHDASPDAPEPTWEQIAAGALNAEVQQGWNDMQLYSEDDFAPDTQYYVSIMTNDYSEADETGTLLMPSKIEVYAAVRNNFLKMSYTRLPMPMLKPESICELAPYLLDAVIAYAKVLAYQKKTGQPQVDTNMMSEFELAIQKSLRFLRKRGESGPSNVFKNPRNVLGGRRRFIRNIIPPGYTRILR